MAAKTSTGLRNYIADTGSLKNALETLVMRVYAGPAPATADAECGGNTLLIEITGNNGTPSEPLSWNAEAVSGVLSKDVGDTWSGVALTSGTAAFFRLEEVSDDQSASTTKLRLQGVVGVVGADLNLSSVSISQGAPQVIDTLSVIVPTY